MYSLLNLLWEICLLRKGPQDLPSSFVLLKFLIFCYALSGLLVLMVGLGADALLIMLVLIAADMALVSGLTYAMLNFLGRTARFVQTLAALFGVGALLQMIALPLSVWLQREQALASGSNAFIPSLLSLLLLAWSVVIMGHILHHAFSVARGIGILYALVYVIISLTMGEWLLPPPAS